jgi:hypothetical protein
LAVWIHEQCSAVHVPTMKYIQSRICLWALPFLLSLATAETEIIVDPRPGFGNPPTEDNVFVPQARIIGGSNAREDRYPYFVSLVDHTGGHTCGGSLVAPDLVVTAGHCQGATRRAQVGRWNRQNSNDDFEDIAIEFPEFPHPDYSDEGFSNDFMIIKLESQSSKPYVMLNMNPNLPQGNIENEVTVMGFGNTISGVTSLANILQEVYLGYIPNPICELSKDPRLDLSYQNRIIDSMLCAGDSGEDSCQVRSSVASFGASGFCLKSDSFVPGRQRGPSYYWWWECRTRCLGWSYILVRSSVVCYGASGFCLKSDDFVLFQGLWLCSPGISWCLLSCERGI